MAIRAPWKGWLKRAMPAVLALVLANILVVFVLAIFNVAAIELSYDGAPAYLEHHALSIRINLLFFWVMIPLFLLVVSVAENWSLWTDRLGAGYVLISSSVAIGLWVLQLALWEPCLGDSTPNYCPWPYQHHAARYPSWISSSPRGAGAAVPTLFILYLIQIALAIKVTLHQRRTSFRKSDLRHTWERKLEDNDKASLVTPSSEETSQLQTPSLEMTHLSDDEDTSTIRPSEDALGSSRTSRRSTLSSSNWLTPLDSATQHPAFQRLVAPPASSTYSSISSLDHDEIDLASPAAHPTFSSRTSPTPTISISGDSLSRSFRTASSEYTPVSERAPPLSERGRSRTNSMSRHYATEYANVMDIAESEQRDAVPEQRRSMDQGLPSGGGRERRRSSTIREMPSALLLGAKRSVEGLGLTGIGGKRGS